MRPLISDVEAHAARQSQEPPIAKPKGTPVAGDAGWRGSLGLEISRNATGRAEGLRAENTAGLHAVTGEARRPGQGWSPQRTRRE